MTDRLTCSVPFCKRTRKNPEGFVSWICGEHWTLTDKKMRKLFFHCKRRASRGDKTRDWPRLADRLWCRLQRQAIERGAGI